MGLSLILLLFLFGLLPQLVYAAGTVGSGTPASCTQTALLDALVGGGTVTFDCGSNPHTISLTGTIFITQPTVIDGDGLITLQGNNTFRIFSVTSQFTLDGVTVRDGNVTGNGAAINVIGSGLHLNIINSQLLSNTSSALGGAIYVDGTNWLTVTHTLLANNQAGTRGGAIVVTTGSGVITTTILNSTFFNNSASTGGGGIRTNNTLLSVANSTFSVNSASTTGGGAIYFTASTGRITNTTFFSNTTTSGSGNAILQSSGLITLTNSIVATGTTTAIGNCGGSVRSGGNNLESGNSCNFTASDDITDINPLLGPLQDNGGQTLTHALLPGSRAVNAGNNSVCAAALVNGLDQRDIPRLSAYDPLCDIGAVEATPLLAITKSSTNEGGNPLRPSERLTYTILITNSGALTATGATISDTLPTHTNFLTVTIAPASAGGSPGTALSQPVVANNVSVTPSSTVTITYVVTVATPLTNGTAIVNVAAVTSAQIITPQLSLAVTDTVTSAPALSIHKSVQDANGGPSLRPGERLTYTIVISNNGDDTARGGLISDTLPAYTIFVPGSVAVDPPDPNVIVAEPPDLVSNLTIPVGQPVTVTLAVTVTTPLTNNTQISNTAAITSLEISTPQLSPPAIITVTSAPVLSIQKSSVDANGGPTLRPGERISYTLVVSNSGDANTTGGVISDTPSLYTTFVPGSVGFDPSGAGLAGAPPAIANSLFIPAGQTVTVTFAVTVSRPLTDQTRIVNAASITSSQTPIPAASNLVTDTVSSAPILSLSKSSVNTGGPPLRTGERLTYTLVVSNSGDANATGGLITDHLPDNTAFAPGSVIINPPDAGDQGALPNPASNLTIPAGQSVTVTLAVTVNQSLFNGTQIVNTASVTSAEVSLAAEDTITDTVSAPELNINKTTSTPIVLAGAPAVYTLVVSNTGPIVATGVVVTDTLPAGFTFQSNVTISPNVPGVLTRTVPLNPVNGQTAFSWGTWSIAPGGSLTITFRASTPITSALYHNTAGVDSGQTQPVVDDGSASDEDVLVIPNAPDLALSKTTLSPVVIAGNIVTYTIIVSNTGSTAATNVIITDTLPTSGFTYRDTISLIQTAGVNRPFSISPTVGSNAFTWGSWTIPSGGVVTITFTANVSTSVTSGSYRNLAGVDSLQTTPVIDDGSNGDQDVTVIAYEPILNISKIALNPLVMAGDIAAYSIAVSNTGTAPATGVVITDTLPETGFTYRNTVTLIQTVGVNRTSLVSPTVGSATFNWGNWTIPSGGAVTITFNANVSYSVITDTYRNLAGIDSSQTDPVIDDGANGDQDVTVNVPPARLIYLPVIFRDFLPAPDLIVTEIVAASNGNVQITIQNQGNAPVVDAFWVDFYVAPNPAPTGVNQLWNDGRSVYGAVWGITPSAFPSLEPGESLTLTIGDAYYAPLLSNLPGSLLAGTAIYAQVDSANANTTYGGVLESHEQTGGVYNNILGGVSTSAQAGQPLPQPSTATEESSTEAGDLPLR